MKYLSIITVSLTATYLLSFSANTVNAQYVSPNNSNGTRKTIEERKYEESKNRQNAYKPVTEPVKSTINNTSPEKIIITTPRPSAPVSRVISFGGKQYTFERDWNLDGLLKVSYVGKWGFVNREGIEIIPVKYDELDESKYRKIKGIIRHQKNGPIHFGNLNIDYYDVTGKVLTADEYDGVTINGTLYQSVGEYYQGIARARSTTGYGFIDQQGKVVIPLIYEDATTSFKDGLVYVKKINGKWLTMNIEGIIVGDWENIACKNETGIFTDSRAGNIYKTIKIGNQTWIAENLVESTFSNGDLITEAKTGEEWIKAGKEKKPAWCYYENDKEKHIYGKLYNWYAVNDIRGLAPKGWHIPSDTEWITLRDYLGGADSASSKMRSSVNWVKHGNGSNESGFSALPAGYRYGNGGFYVFGSKGYWWSTKDFDINNAWYFSLAGTYTDAAKSNYSEKINGWSVRCLKD